MSKNKPSVQHVSFVERMLVVSGWELAAYVRILKELARTKRQLAPDIITLYMWQVRRPHTPLSHCPLRMPLLVPAAAVAGSGRK